MRGDGCSRKTNITFTFLEVPGGSSSSPLPVEDCRERFQVEHGKNHPFYGGTVKILDLLAYFNYIRGILIQ